MTYKLLILSIFTFLFSCSGSKKKINADQFKGEDGVYLSFENKHILNNDGSSTFRVSFEFLALKTGITYQDSILYNTNYQDFNILHAGFIDSTGKKQKIPSGQFVFKNPSVLKQHPDSLLLNQVSFNFKHLARNERIKIAYEIISKPDFVPYFMDYTKLSTRFPALQYNYEVETEMEDSLRIYTFPEKIDPLIKRTRSSKNYSFTRSDFIKKEDNYIRISSNPGNYLLCSTAENPGKIIDYMIGQLAFSGTFDRDISKTLMSMRNAWETEQYNINKLYHFTTENIMDVPFEEKYRAFRIHDINEVYKHTSGTKLEKTLFLSSALNLFGISAQTFAVCDPQFLNNSASNPLVFDSYVIRVRYQNEDSSFISVTPPNLELELRNKALFSLDPNNLYAYFKKE